MTLHLPASRLAAGDIALVDDSSEYNWSEFDDMVCRAAVAISERNLGPLRRVAVYAENASQTVVAYAGALLAGASSVPINYHLTAAEARFILEHSKTEILFVGAANLDRAVDACEGLDIEIVAWAANDPTARDSTANDPTAAVSTVTPWSEFLATDPDRIDLDSVTPRPSLMYTSGTTGFPKATEVPPTMFAGGDSIREHLERLELDPRVGLGAHLVAGPMYHTGPLAGMRLAVVGVPTIVSSRFDPEAVLASIERYRVATSTMVPTHFKRFLELDSATRQRYDVSSLQSIGQTGSKCPDDVKRAMIDWWGPVINEAYGATEVGTTCYITAAEWLLKPGSVGRALLPFEALVVDDDGHELPPNHEGRLHFRDTTGRGVIYDGSPEASLAVHLEPGVFTLGEIGYVDDDGYVFITDRFSDMVVSGGVNIYPAEAEARLGQHPGVVDVGCIGVPDEAMGERLVALVITRSDVGANELMAFCRDGLSHYKCPREVFIVGDIGRNAMGKVNKRALRDSFLADESVASTPTM